MVQTRSQTKKQKEIELSVDNWFRTTKKQKEEEDYILEVEEKEVDTNCDRCGHEDIEWCMSNGCGDEEEELDANGNSNSDYKKAEKECPIGYIVVWNRWEKGFKYRKLDKDGYLQKEEELDAWCYRCDKFFSADTEEGGDDGTEEEEWVCNSCFKDINNSSRIVEYN